MEEIKTEDLFMSVENKISEIVEAVYFKLKSNSKSYKELEDAIFEFHRKYCWKNPEHAKILHDDLIKRLRIEQGSVLIK